MLWASLSSDQRLMSTKSLSFAAGQSNLRNSSIVTGCALSRKRFSSRERLSMRKRMTLGGSLRRRMYSGREIWPVCATSNSQKTSHAAQTASMVQRLQRSFTNCLLLGNEPPTADAPLLPPIVSPNCGVSAPREAPPAPPGPQASRPLADPSRPPCCEFSHIPVPFLVLARCTKLFAARMLFCAESVIAVLPPKNLEPIFARKNLDRRPLSSSRMAVPFGE
mmetsp:Transcript_2435/g.7161  ORF Transcript_2435/g.7161 Transcript_2435/m.7161 type:complete len:221 (+) Transcript_2435:423-1085(+)